MSLAREFLGGPLDGDRPAYVGNVYEQPGGRYVLTFGTRFGTHYCWHRWDADDADEAPSDDFTERVMRAIRDAHPDWFPPEQAA